MNKTVASLALLKVNWDNRREDYIDSFVPFIVTLIQKEKYRTINVGTVRDDFETEYNLSIPYHPMLAILNRTMQKGYIERDSYRRYLPIAQRISGDAFANIAAEQERKYMKVINEFVQYCWKEFEMTISESDADAAIISFLREYDLDILFIAQERNSVLPEIGASTAHNFLAKRFIANAYEREPETFTFITDMSVGHIIANTLLYRNYDKFEGKLEGTSFYLDTGILFNVLGIDGPEKKDAYIEFIQLLSSHGSRTFVFHHTLDEYKGILESCLRWIDNDYYDPVLASRTLTHFKDEGATSSDIEQFILSVDSNLSELGIEVVGRPDPSTDQIYQIDEEKLQERIIAAYSPRFDETEKEKTLLHDVRSIAAISKLRKGDKPTKLEDATHIFVTTNSSLAYASRAFELENTDCSYFFIPAVLTDVFVGTIAWIQSPSQVNINTKRLIANCYAAIQPSKPLIRKLVDAADRLKEKGQITGEEITVLRESRVARNLLQKKTLGDLNRFEDKTVLEILEEIRAQAKREEQEAYREREKAIIDQLEAVQRDANLAKEKQSIAVAAREQIVERVEALAEQVTRVIAVSYYILSWAVVVVVSIFQFVPTNFLADKKILNYLLRTVAIILTIVNLMTGFNFKGSRDTIKRKLKKLIISYFRKDDPD